MIDIAFFRGINVGGKNVIKMPDLKKALQSMGLVKVQTYIQSGNLLFESDEDETTLRERIESTVLEVFGISAAVILRNLKELEQTAASCPYSDDEISTAQSATDAESLYVALLERAPLPEEINRLDVYKRETDQYRVVGRDLYLLFHHSIRDSKLATNLQRLDIPSTVRNWNTIRKLVDLARAMVS
jgi:uncharacterized protein (DUF1697 family)